jgi:hypothetical protein
METKHKTAVWIVAFLLMGVIDFLLVILAISFFHDLIISWEGNTTDYVLILGVGLFFLVAIAAADLILFFGAKGLITKHGSG